jgi:hypothetical protein
LGTTDGVSGSGARSGGTRGIKWVRLVRNGTTFTGSYSQDGVEWTSLGSKTVAMTGSSCLGGVAVTAHKTTATYAQSFSHVSLGDGLIGADIGSPDQVGSATFANGMWMVIGGGRDIWNSADQFHYAHTVISGNETITARVGTDAEPMVIALGKPDRLFLTRPYAGQTAVQDLYIQLPVGYHNTAYYDAEAHAWDWQRDQIWDKTRPDRHIFTMSWSKNHVQGWADTYSNGGCWDWLLSQSLRSVPGISVQPQSLGVVEGAPAIFTVGSYGTDPLRWQWLRDDVEVAGATAPTLTIHSTARADNGSSFTVNVTNGLGTARSEAAVLTILPSPPTIITQPENQTVSDGQVATFSVVAIGSGSLTWQWFLDGQSIVGAIASSHTTTENSMAAIGGQFFATVSNAGGSVTSATAVLMVTASPPVITRQPVDATARIGQSAIFDIAVIGTPALELQWQRAAPADGDWLDVAGAVALTYHTTGMLVNENGSRYRCRVRNAVGESVSDTVSLTVDMTTNTDGSNSVSGGGGCGVGTAAAVFLAFLALIGPRQRVWRLLSRPSTLII